MEKGVPGRRNSKCQGPEAGRSVVCEGQWEASVVGCNGLGERMEGEFRGGGPTVWGLGSRAGLWRAESR